MRHSLRWGEVVRLSSYPPVKSSRSLLHKLHFSILERWPGFANFIPDAHPLIAVYSLFLHRLPIYPQNLQQKRRLLPIPKAEIPLPFRRIPGMREIGKEWKGEKPDRGIDQL